jgi:hypothetical protein
MRHVLPALVLRALLGIAGPARDQVANPDEVEELLEVKGGAVIVI